MRKDKISSGVDKLDLLIDSFYVGDNVLWEVEAGTSHQHFVRSFLRRSLKDGCKTIFVSFNHSPQSIIDKYGGILDENFILLDCFTSGKGKDDHTFAKYYDGDISSNIIRINRPADIELFTQRLNEIEDRLPSGACYVFDSLTGMQDLWSDEDNTYKFFTYMCPRLYDLETVAYWIMEKGAHSSNFKANLRHITQVVMELSKKNDNLFIKALKLEGRHDREAFRSQQYRIIKDKVSIIPSNKQTAADIDIGSKIRKLRTMLDMSQKNLADKVGLTASSISQLENNQISPTMNNFVIICSALKTSPAEFWEEKKEPSWIIRGTNVIANGKESIFSSGKSSGYIKAIDPGSGARLNAEGGKFVYVLKGSVNVTVNKEAFRLMEGDAVLLKKGQMSSWKNIGSSQVMLLWVDLA